MTEYSKIARGSFTTAADPVLQVVNLPFQPQRVELKNVTSFNSPDQFETTDAFWDISMAQGTAVQEYFGAASFPWNIAGDFVAVGGISTFAAGLLLQYGAPVNIASITKNAGTPIVTTVAVHGLATGDVVILENLYQSPTTGMQQIAGIPFIVTVTGVTTFTINYDNSGSNFTALSGLVSGPTLRQVLYPWLYLPGVNFIASISTGTTTAVTTTSNHNFVVGQEIAFRIPSLYGTTGLNSLPNPFVPGSPVYGYVTAVTSNTGFICNINSSSFAAFNPNQPFASFPGLQFPQVLAVGDVNTGGFPYTGGALYPSPAFPTFSGGVPTINGPAIMGAFVNNTNQGFTVGLGSGQAATSHEDSAPLLAGSSLYVWTAYFYDLSL